MARRQASAEGLCGTVGPGLKLITDGTVTAWINTLVEGVKKITERYGGPEGATQAVADFKTALVTVGAFVGGAWLTGMLASFAAVSAAATALGVGLTPLARLIAGPAALAGGAALATNEGMLGAGVAEGRSWHESIIRGLDPGIADRIYGPTSQQQERAQGGTLWQKTKRFLGIGGGAGDGAGTPAGRFTALKNLIQSRESGGAKYDSVYGNGRYGWPSKPVTEMTVAEALAYQAEMKAKVGSEAFPVGRGQFIESTLRRLANATGTMNEKMTPELQERFMDVLIRGRGRNVEALRQEWKGLRGVSDEAILRAYDTDGTGSAATSAKPRAGTYTDGGNRLWDGLKWLRRGPDGGFYIEKPAGRPLNTDWLRGGVKPGDEATIGSMPGSWARRAAAAQNTFRRFDLDQGRRTFDYVPIGGWGSSSTNNDNRSVSMSGDTTINVTTTGDAHETADIIKRSQERRRSDLIENMTSRLA